MPQKSFVTPGIQPPYAQDMSSLAQEQAALQEALAQQRGGVTAKPIDSGAYQVLNFDGLANALAAKETQRALENNRKKSMDVQGKYQQGLVESLKKFDTSSQGGEIELPGPTEGGQPLTGQVPGDQRAFTKFLSSPYPEVRAAAERQKADYDKRAAALLPRADFGSVQAGGENLGAYTPKKDFKEVNGAIMNMGEGGPPTVVPGMGVTQRTLPSGTEVNQLPGGKLDSVDKAPKTTINMPGKRVVEKMIDSLPDDLKAANAANSAIRGTETALKALENGAKAGYGQDFIQNARTLVSSLTGVQFEAQTETAVLAKALAKNVIDELGGLGAQISNTDRDFMATAVGGTNTDPAALERILAIRMAALQKSVRKHNADVELLASEPKNDMGDFTRQKYSVNENKIGMKFRSPEAEASYLAGYKNISYDEAMKEVQAMRASDPQSGAKPAATKPNAAAQTDRDARLKALGITPYKGN